MNAQAGDGSTPVAEPTTPGELLCQERKRRALSVQQAAEDLHLDVWMIEAIEANRFVALGAPVYAKGHLRKYATLLGLSPDFIIERYQALGDTPDVPAPIPATVVAPALRERRSVRAPLLWIFAAVVVLGAAWWLFRNFAPLSPSGTEVTPAPIATSANEHPAQAVPAADMVPVAADDPQAATLTSVSSDATTSEPAPASAAAAVSDPADGASQIQLHLAFSEACWTEVYDAAGKQLMFDLGAPGQARTVSGAAPLHVTLGLASAVTAQVGDSPIVVPRRAGRDATKFVIEADGSVRLE